MGLKAHNYEAIKIELLEKSNRSGELTHQSDGLTYDTTKLLEGVEKSYEKGKKVASVRGAS